MLDVPGIEGSEDTVINEVHEALQASHAVFYIVNQPTPPQTGDEQFKGTLEKIKEHLGIQTEVWIIYNKKITNPKYSFVGESFTNQDEMSSLVDLEEKMHEVLGSNFKKVITITALSAFIASTSNFSPRSENSKRRKKFLTDFDEYLLFENSGFKNLVDLLESEILNGCEDKIIKANFKKVSEILLESISKVKKLKINLDGLINNIIVDSNSCKIQIVNSFKKFQICLDNHCKNQVDLFEDDARSTVYALIESGIDNGDLKNEMKNVIKKGQDSLSQRLADKIGDEVNGFKNEIVKIIKNFEDQINDLESIYSGFTGVKFKSGFELKFDIDSGVKYVAILTGLIGIVLTIWNPVFWVLDAIAILGLLFSMYKGIAGFFNENYKKSQQRKEVDKNLEKITASLREQIYDKLNESYPKMQEQISLIEKAVEYPGLQGEVLLTNIDYFLDKMADLSNQIKGEEIVLW